MSGMKRLASAMFVLVAALGGAGCVGSLSDADAFIDGGTIPKDAQTVFEQSCGTIGCHDDVTTAENLNLLSPGVESRVLNVNATGVGCEARILVVAGDPNSSYLFDKILGTIGVCGSRMPLLSILPDSDVEVLREWIIELGGSGQGTPDGG
ncbi:MAG: hypothetical protein WBB42_15875 [Polyangiales bacterium]